MMHRIALIAVLSAMALVPGARAQAAAGAEAADVPWEPMRVGAKQPEEEPDLPPTLGPPAGQSIIEDLSRRLWDDRGLRKARKERSGSETVWKYLARASHSLEAGDGASALRSLKSAVHRARTHSHGETLMVHGLLVRLAEQYVAAGDLASAARVYQEVLKLGRYLPAGYTGAALNDLINTHFDLGDYETALMYVRIGIAVLDDVGIGPYLAMNRIIQEMSALEGPITDLEDDFDAAMARLEAAAANAEAAGLVIEEQWWAPVYFARHDRERAITLLKLLMRPGPDDVLRDAAAEADAP